MIILCFRHHMHRKAGPRERKGCPVLNSILFSVVVFVLVALLLLCLILLFASVSKPKLRPADLPRCDRKELLSAKERTMLQALQTVGVKSGMSAYPRVTLGAILQPVPSAENADLWSKRLSEEYADFVLCDKDTLAVRLVVIHGDKMSPERKAQAEIIEKACDMAGIPFLVVREYNLPGLEKALEQKITPLPPPTRQGRVGRVAASASVT